MAFYVYAPGSILSLKDSAVQADTAGLKYPPLGLLFSWQTVLAEYPTGLPTHQIRFTTLKVALPAGEGMKLSGEGLELPPHCWDLLHLLPEASG